MLFAQKTEYDQKNKVLWDFTIKSNHLIPTRRTHLQLIYKKREAAVYWILPLTAE